MPIYEYRCLKCGYQFEQLQKINSSDLIICPQCQAPKLQRLISNTSFQLKGSGWYITDYKNKQNNKSAISNSSPANDQKATKTSPDKTTQKDKSKDSKTD